MSLSEEVPSISVIIPSYNRAHTLPVALDGLCRQTYRRFEAVIVDDGSTDDTVSVVERYADPRFRLKQIHHSGNPGYARNIGVSVAEGRWVTFLDSDDAVLAGWLEALVAVLSTRHTQVARCGVLRLGPDGVMAQLVFPGDSRHFGTWVNTFLPGAYALDRKLMQRLGGFDERLGFGEHTELAMRLWSDRRSRRWRVCAHQRPLVRKTWSGGAGKYRESQLRMARFVLEEHSELLRSYPGVKATYEAIVGVGFAKQREFRDARSFLLRSWRTEPWSPRRAARALVALLPSASRAVWAKAPAQSESRERFAPTPAPPLPRASDSQPPASVSVVIPVFNGADTLDAQLLALSEQDYEGRWDVIVSDNGSTDGSGEIVARWTGRLPGLRLVDSSDKQGVGHAVNVGARASSTDLIAICEQDDTVDRGWISGLADAAATADMVGGRLDIRSLNSPAATAGRELLVDKLPGWGVQFLPFAQGGNTAIWRNVFEGVGWRDESYPVSGDKELSWRVQLSGYRLAYAPRASIRYRLREEPGALVRQSWGYGIDDARLHREFRLAGAGKRSWVSAARTWGWILLHAPEAARRGPHRMSWLRVATRSAAHISGSIKHRVLYP